MKKGKIIKWIVVILISLIVIYIYMLFNGTPWEKIQQAAKMESYLESKYQQPFVIKRKHYNFLSETYQADVYPKEHSDLVFFVEEDVDSSSGYSDTYPAVFWESNRSSEIKAKVKELFPDLDEYTLQVKRIVERGEMYGPNIPRYEDVPVSQSTCSLTINIHNKWEQMDQNTEFQRIKELSQYLKVVHYPVFVEIWYSDLERNPDHTKAIFIAEDGRIIEK